MWKVGAKRQTNMPIKRKDLPLNCYLLLITIKIVIATTTPSVTQPAVLPKKCPTLNAVDILETPKFFNIGCDSVKVFQNNVFLAGTMTELLKFIEAHHFRHPQL